MSDGTMELETANSFSSTSLKKNKRPQLQPQQQATTADEDVEIDMSGQHRRVINIATISSGFEKGDFLVREEKGQRVYFDFFEEAFNYIANKGYARMEKQEEDDWIELMGQIHGSIKGGMRYNTGTLLMVLSKPIIDFRKQASEVEKTKTQPPPPKCNSGMV